mgnify:CR=1 FL=1
MTDRVHVFKNLSGFRDFLDENPDLYDSGDALHNFLERCAFYRVCCKCERVQVKDDIISQAIQLPFSIFPVQKKSIKEKLDAGFVELYYGSERLFRM